jgi:hypothetical protein
MVGRGSSWRLGLAGSAIAAAIAVSGCSGSSASSAPAATVAPSPTRSPAPGGGGQAQGSVSASQATEPIDLDVEGTIGGQQVSGKLTHTSFTIACNGAGPDQILVVHWIGTSPSGPGLNGAFDLKPGTWQLGSSSEQGTATIGNIAGASLVGTAGTITTQPTGGSITNGVFNQGSGQVTVNGSWTCPGS